ncbi:hypothetical protein Acr_24g0002110 [Actinidia rufa]|uniref:Uncharacterized protein n=1 Tax=Actinidia rufa TaxID=165716 RepID=A0A7J0GTH2_9ERIC|nr:hypothetical protein Acr_24g0002110 [Actinidia rufa]
MASREGGGRKRGHSGSGVEGMVQGRGAVGGDEGQATRRSLSPPQLMRREGSLQVVARGGHLLSLSLSPPNLEWGVVAMEERIMEVVVRIGGEG